MYAEEISDEDYQHAHNVWNKFNCQTLQDYHDIYLKSDVLLQADVFENFRKKCLINYKLDPCYYYTAPGLAWDACLKLTKQELELLTDYDMLMMFEKGIRGGMTHISKRRKFEENFFKLMSNAVFGKTIENIRKRQNVEIIDNRKKALKFSSKPNFDRVTIFDENLVAIHMKKTEVYFNKLIFVGQAILDISKTHMFDFHYNFIKDKYGDKAELLFTDSDSLVYLIQTNAVYKDIKKDIEKNFDTSNFHENHPSGIKAGINEKEIGIFKFEIGGNQIIIFIGLRPKLYAFKVEKKYEEKDGKIKEIDLKEEIKCKAKGVKKSVIKKSLSLEDYKKCLFSEEKQMRQMNIFRTKNHDVYSTTVNKVALSSNDDKRQIFKNKINTLALRPKDKKNNIT